MKDWWLSRPTTYTVHSPPSILDLNATVSQLIVADTNWWNYALLERLFSWEENISILSVPLSNTDQEDKLIWKGMAKGLFSVRSAYQLEKEQEAASKAEGSSQVRHRDVWRSIWRQKITNAEKHFLWRACHEILPTKANLCSRKVTMDSCCPVCERADETTYHVLWQCPAARDVWSAGCVKFQKSCLGGPSFL